MLWRLVEVDTDGGSLWNERWSRVGGGGNDDYQQ